jgi:hypothetical protein
MENNTIMKKAAALSLLVSLSAFVFGQKPAIVKNDDAGWQKIGEIRAGFRTRSESILVLGADDFSSIKLKVNDAPIHIDQVQVFYENGEMEEVDVDDELQAGDETREISLRGGDQEIKKVAFTYRTLANNDSKQAEVELHGLKGNRPDTGVSNSDRYRNDRDEDGTETEQSMQNAADTVERAAERTEDDIENAADNSRDEIRERSNVVSDEAEDTTEAIKEEADVAAEDVRKEANETADELKEEKEEAKDQVENAVENADDEGDRKTNKLEDQVNEDWANIKADIKDKIYKDKRGPNNELIYIDKNSKYYYINNKGKKVSITKAEMRDKNDN